MLALVDRCCDVTGYQVRPGLSGGGGGHSLAWGYEHRGQMAFLTGTRTGNPHQSHC